MLGGFMVQKAELGKRSEELVRKMIAEKSG
jgi:hypothetical protein